MSEPESEMEVRFTQRPGWAGQLIVQRFVCPEGHEVVGSSSHPTAVVDRTDPRKYTIECEACDQHFRLVQHYTLEPTEVCDVCERAIWDGYCEVCGVES